MATSKGKTVLNIAGLKSVPKNEFILQNCVVSYVHFLPQPCNTFTQIYLPNQWHFATLPETCMWSLSRPEQWSFSELGLANVFFRGHHWHWWFFNGFSMVLCVCLFLLVLIFVFVSFSCYWVSFCICACICICTVNGMYSNECACC